MNDSNFPAFPVESTESLYPGLTKRELFAAMAMQSLIAAQEEYDPEGVGLAAVAYADELLICLEEDEFLSAEPEIAQTRFSQDSLVESLNVSLRTFQRWRAALKIKIKRYYSVEEKAEFFKLKNRLEDKEGFNEAINAILAEKNF